MYLQDSFTRLLEFQKRHGFWSTARRLFFSLQRAVCCYRMVLFYCDLNGWNPSRESHTHPLIIEQKVSQADLSSEELGLLENAWNPSIMRRLMGERFQRGATLWVAKWEKQLAGYGWTLSGTTIEPYFFPVSTHDVHLFDFCVFPEYRGRRINPSLVAHILSELAAEGKSRAFIEAEEWNQSQLSSLSRTPFQPLGLALRFRILGKTLVLWSATPLPAKPVHEMRRTPRAILR